MHITFAPKGILQIDDARIIFRNFSGEGSKFNREGDRNFAVVIEDQEIADALTKEGWNVKVKPPREEGDTPLMFIPVKIKFNGRGPIVYLKSGAKDPVRLCDFENCGDTAEEMRACEDEINCFDYIDIIAVDMDLRPYDWEVNGKEGRTAYLQSIHVTQDVDRFAERYESLR